MNRRTNWIRLALLGAVLSVVLLGLVDSPANITLAQTGGTLSYGSRLYATLSTEAPAATYSFTGNAGDLVTVLVESWTGTLDAQIDLIAPNGVILAASDRNRRDDEPLGAYLAAVLPDAGIYLLRISGQNGTTGDFLLTLLGRGALTATALAYDQPVDVAIPPGASPQYFSFVVEDCPTTLLVTNPAEGLPFTFPFLVKVRDQRGQTVALLRGGEELEDWVTLAPYSGRYEVEVRAADPAVAGSLRLLVTCSSDNPGCPPGQPIAGLPGGLAGLEACLPCPDPDDEVPGGGCPDLNFRAWQSEGNPLEIIVRWDAAPGADGYAVYVIGLLGGGGEVYLTHSVWTPGDPLVFTAVLPEGYAGFRFILRVYSGDVMICTAETEVTIEGGPTCEHFTAWLAEQTDTSVTVGWSDYPGADGYWVAVGNAATRMLLPGWPVVLLPSEHSTSITGLLPGDYFVAVAPYLPRGGPICIREVPFTVGGGPGEQFICTISTDRRDVPVRVGPGYTRAIFAFLTPGMEYGVVGQATDGDGNLWWQIDKTLIPGHEMVISLWVAADDVEENGTWCANVPPGDVPPLIPQEPERPTGQWLPCGSCDTCGHPASECVTSPEGECLWDPASCAGVPPDDGSGCYAVIAAVDPGRCQTPVSAMLDTPPNCGSRYTPGTTINAHAVAVDPKCNVEYWSGCGASGTENSITFTPTGSCTITAHMYYGN